MTLDLVIHGVRLADDALVADDAWVAFAAGEVVGRGSGESWRELDTRSSHDGRGDVLTPGLIDIHGHGGGGFAYDDGVAAIRRARALHRAHGTTRAVVSLVSASLDDLVTRLAMVADAAADDPEILGSHLEGPFLDPGHRGAHGADLLLSPDPASVDRLITAGRGTIRQVTIAPELAGASEAMRRFVADGITVAIGHTDADFDGATQAFADGATLLTHAFNAMRGIHHRDPGPVTAALHDRRVTLELIADGVHVDPALFPVLFATARGRIALVTDAMAAAGSHDGTYRLGSQDVEVRGGVARVSEGGAIAGSTLTQDAALRAVVESGVDLAHAVHASTQAPARALGLHHRFGSLAPGFIADAVLWDDAFTVKRVWIAGEMLDATADERTGDSRGATDRLGSIAPTPR